MDQLEEEKRILIVAGARLDQKGKERYEAIGVRSSCEVRFVDHVSEVIELVKRYGWAFVLREINTVEDLKLQVFFSKNIKPQLEEGRIFLFGLNCINHPQVRGILAKMGFKEVVSTLNLNAAAIDERLIRALKVDRSALGRTVLNIGEIDELGKSAPLVIGEESFRFVDPSALPQNCWLLRRSYDVKQVRQQWVVDLLGPGPSAGKWSRRPEEPLNPADGHAVWEWKPKGHEDAEKFFGKDGSWMFWGKKPRFSEFHWTFISRNPRLAFFKGDQFVGNVFAMGKDQRLEIPRNSPLALQRWPDIHSSIMNEYKFQKAVKVLESPVKFFEKFQKNSVEWGDLIGAVGEHQGLKGPSKMERLAKFQRGVAPREALFNSVTDPEARGNYLKEMKAEKSSVQIWTPEQRVRFTAKVLDVNVVESAIAVNIPESVPIEELFDKLFVNIAFNRASVFFSLTARDLAFDGERLILRVPRDVYEVQRRNFYRLSLLEDESFFVRVGERFFKALNLSAGGVAVLADLADQELFVMEAELEKISFEINGIRVVCRAQVRWVKEEPGALDGYNLRVGLKFLSMNPSDKQRINMYVLENGYAFMQENIG